MAVVPEIPCINIIDDDVFKGFNHISERDRALLMSLLEESQQVDETDDNERLTSVIQSLEAEIHPTPIMEISRDSGMRVEVADGGDDDDDDAHNHFHNIEEMEDSGLLESLLHLDNLGWLDMEEMMMEASSPSSDEDIMNWHSEPPQNDMNSRVDGEFGIVRDYSQMPHYEIFLEEYGCSSFWQEGYDATMYY